MEHRVKLIEASNCYDDAKLIFTSWGRNSGNFTYLSTRPLLSVAQARHFLETTLAHGSGNCFHINYGNQTVGFIKAKIEDHRALIGYIVEQKFWGRGIATESLRQFLFHLSADKRLLRIWATCAIDNPGSVKVLEKNGFVREGVLKNWIFYPVQGDRPQDNYCYVLPTMG